ncbi:PHP domain-containing protein [uncultured Desulfovibrio sp.]|uniref:PHP domain-containing protein n=1 Tax=uncultured Desulfovibrio sp. TaxID=167968 RepID=UPI00262561E9|nr:PHP domain-containing protein [uncultured Desulfovibrio sp.]
MPFIDLHTHSQASDGTDSPAQLVRNAAAAGLAAVALTDHDTLSGLAEAEAAARDCGIEFIRGCELSTRTEHGEMHILGLWLPHEADPLERRLAEVRRKRDQRNARILDKLADLGIRIGMDELLHEARGESVGRPHIAALLVQKGVVPDMSAAFRDYLGSGGRAYLPREILDPEEAVCLMARLGATVCLAHPCLQALPRDWLETFILRLRDCGLSAIEAYHSEHGDADTRACIDLARRLDLGISGGSDYHGANKPRLRLGFGYGGLRVPLAVLDGLKARRRAKGLPC